MKYPETPLELPDKKRTAKILFFPRGRIVRTILRGNRVYDVPRQEGWDNDAQGDAPKSA